MATDRILIHESLTQNLDKLKEEIATALKKKYELDEIVVPRTLSSQILAAKMNGKKFIDFRIRKSGNSKGFMELL